jgi:regulatory protein
LGLIAKRDYASAELARKLRQKGYEATEVTLLVAEFAERELVSDLRYATNRWRYRQEASRWGRTRIVQELKQAGVVPDVLALLLEQHKDADEEAVGTNDEFTRAYELACKKFKVLGSPPARSFTPEGEKASKKYQSEKNRRLSFLLRRGFSMAAASVAVAKLG